MNNSLIYINKVHTKLLIANTILYMFITYFFVIAHVGMVNYYNYAYITAYNIYNHLSFFYVFYSESILKKFIFSFLNICISIPLTLCFFLFFDRMKRKLKYILPILLVNFIFLGYELLQFFCHIGMFELFDVAMYIIGTLFALIMYKSLREKTTIVVINRTLLITMIIMSVLCLLSIYPLIRQAKYIYHFYQQLCL